MTRCPSSKPKHRHSNTGKGNPSDYKHGMRGHVYERLTKEIYQDTDSTLSVCIGRKCKNCGKVVLNPTGEKYSS